MITLGMNATAATLEYLIKRKPNKSTLHDTQMTSSGTSSGSHFIQISIICILTYMWIYKHLKAHHQELPHQLVAQLIDAKEVYLMRCVICSMYVFIYIFMCMYMCIYVCIYICTDHHHHGYINRRNQC